MQHDYCIALSSLEDQVHPFFVYSKYMVLNKYFTCACIAVGWLSRVKSQKVIARRLSRGIFNVDDYLYHASHVERRIIYDAEIMMRKCSALLKSSDFFSVTKFNRDSAQKPERSVALEHARTIGPKRRSGIVR